MQTFSRNLILIGAILLFPRIHIHAIEELKPFSNEMHRVLAEQDKEGLDKFLQQGFPINSIDENNFTVLHYAEKKPEILKILLGKS